MAIDLEQGIREIQDGMSLVYASRDVKDLLDMHHTAVRAKLRVVTDKAKGATRHVIRELERLPDGQAVDFGGIVIGRDGDVLFQLRPDNTRRPYASAGDAAEAVRKKVGAVLKTRYGLGLRRMNWRR